MHCIDSTDHLFIDLLNSPAPLLQAYMILRSHSDFIISLFGMMISTGLPDVSSEDDLRFLHSTLVSGPRINCSVFVNEERWGSYLQSVCPRLEDSDMVFGGWSLDAVMW